MNAGKHSSKFMDKAWEAAENSNCRRRNVGAVIVRDGQILVTASNGTPTGMTSCRDSGCPRCLSDTDTGEQYESCLCIHAEQAAVARAAQAGISIEGTTLYCTLRPCLTCAKLCHKAGIMSIVYEQDIEFGAEVENAYELFAQGTGLNLVKWSNNK